MNPAPYHPGHILGWGFSFARAVGQPPFRRKKFIMQKRECDLAEHESDCTYCCCRCAVQACPVRCTREDYKQCEHYIKDSTGRNFLRLVA